MCEYSKKLTINKIYKIRLEHTYNQNIFIEHTEIESLNTQPILLQIYLERVDSNNQFFNYKTTHKSTRGFHTNMHDKYIGDKNNVEQIFLNENGNVTETRFHNIIIEADNSKYTPKLSDGVLDGIGIKNLIDKGDINVKSISLSELKSADKIYLINSVRGIIPAYLEVIE